MRKPSMDRITAKQSTPQKHKAELIDMNVESIITETLIQSQINAKKEAERLFKLNENEKRDSSPSLDEHIEEDIIVYQNKNFATKIQQPVPSATATNLVNETLIHPANKKTSEQHSIEKIEEIPVQLYKSKNDKVINTLEKYSNSDSII